MSWIEVNIRGIVAVSLNQAWTKSEELGHTWYLNEMTYAFGELHHKRKARSFKSQRYHHRSLSEHHKGIEWMLWVAICKISAGTCKSLWRRRRSSPIDRLLGSSCCRIAVYSNFQNFKSTLLLQCTLLAFIRWGRLRSVPFAQKDVKLPHRNLKKSPLQ